MIRVTIADVAKAAGVSKSTVSQYLNNRYEYMSENTREKIKEAIEKLGYRPNYIARSLKQKRTSMIGIIVANIMHRFSTEVSRAIEDYCHANDMNAIVCNADDDPEKEKKYIEMLLAKQVDGMIIFPTGQNIQLYKRMAQDRYPVVFMDRKVENLKVHTIVVNNEEIMRRAVDHFIEQGHRNIAILTPPLTISPRIERMEGYKRALRENGLDLKEDYMVNVETKAIKQALESLFSLKNPPSALLAGNDLVLLEIMEFFTEKNIKVKKDVSLIAFDNIKFAHIANPPITTIGQPAFEMGEQAAKILLAQINKQEIEPKEYIFPCQLNIRESSLR